MDQQMDVSYGRKRGYSQDSSTKTLVWKGRGLGSGNGILWWDGTVPGMKFSPYEIRSRKGARLRRRPLQKQDGGISRSRLFV